MWFNIPVVPALSNKKNASYVKSILTEEKKEPKVGCLVKKAAVRIGFATLVPRKFH